MRGVELTVEQRAQVVSLRESNHTYEDIAKIVGISSSTASKTYKNFKERGTLETAPRPGRPKKWTERNERHIIREKVKEPTSTSGELSSALNGIPRSKIRETRKKYDRMHKFERMQPFIRAKIRNEAAKMAEAEAELQEEHESEVEFYIDVVSGPRLARRRAKERRERLANKSSYGY